MRIFTAILFVLLLACASAAHADVDAGFVAAQKKDYALALKEWKAQADKGYAAAQNNLGAMCANGQGVPQNDQEAAKWYRLAAAQGNVDAQINLGNVYANGVGMPQDYKEAANWYRMAADQGNVEAQNQLGLEYANGQGVPQDFKEAAKWYRLAADQGNANAQYNLGAIYARGMGDSGTPDAEPNFQEAAKWYRLAAGQGNAAAQFSLGYLSAHGRGVPTSFHESIKWYLLAAAQGNATAQNNLGYMYAHGQGVEQDSDEAARWYRLAAEPKPAAKPGKHQVAYVADTVSHPPPPPPPPPPVKEEPLAPPPEPKLTITAFQVSGNTMLSDAAVQAVLKPLTGPNAGMERIDQAVKALRAAYTKAGYPVVQIYPPEQAIQDGVVALRVVEGKISEVAVAGNKTFNEANIRNSVPALKEGQAPNVRAMVAEVAMANESPAKQVAVTLQPGAAAGDVVANINVTEDHPQKVVASYDNYGTQATGYDRVSIGYQNANMFNRDQMATAQFTTTVEHPDAVKDLSLGYRIPFYNKGLSLDLIAAYSDSASTNASTGTASIGPVQFTGKGVTLGARLNQSLPGIGDYRQKGSVEFDYMNFNDQCMVDGISAGSCGTVTAMPLTVNYMGVLTLPTLTAGGNLSVAQNVPGGPNGSAADYAAASQGAIRDWRVLRGGAYVVEPLPRDWQLRANLSMQDTRDDLIPAEQFGIGGASSVRGFDERVLAGDKGLGFSLELYTPDLGATVKTTAKVRGLLFADYGAVRDNDGAHIGTATLRSFGLGLRYDFLKSWNMKLDVGLGQRASFDPSWNASVNKLNDDPGRWLGPVQLSISNTF